MESIIFLMIGIVLGYVLSRVVPKEKPVGTLRVDRSDPDSGPYLFLELTQQGAGSIQKKKYVLFKVDLKSYISQE